ncbi:protein ASYMMETRIC LEAVES 2-like [Nymphaea colorata]|uniref:LOB domain-containing protein n=1 Tax=Nymphaea colorata TaxID=210225 RepID=A0A5K1BDV7_9MAGN|nr:protein ASYMMETRIC LEAVES 2-like [Nymphaea colorata]
MSSSSNSPCAACKFLRRKCTFECAFAPYFPPDQPQKFANVHKVFGASNVTKLLNELLPHQREDAVNSLAYEAQARVQDPVYGCVGVISLLQHQLKQLHSHLSFARSELSKHINAGGFSFGIVPSSGAGAAGIFVPHATIDGHLKSRVFMRAAGGAAVTEMGARLGRTGGYDGGGLVSLNMNVDGNFVGGLAPRHPEAARGEKKTAAGRSIGP